jgi:hypothetical protein
MIRYLIGAGVLVCACAIAFAGDRPTAKESVKSEPKLDSMRFEWRLEGPADACKQNCRTWISAVGPVTDRTARDFEAFAAANNVKGATMVLDSEGGSVLAALALGRTIRRLGITTTVGRTAALPSNDGTAPRATLSPRASCESMCVFILLGGAERYVPPEAHVLVHQIWLGSKSKRALESSYSAEELGLVQRDIGSLARYTVEMGGGIELIETALRVPPWEPMYALSADEIRRMRLTTIDHLFDTDIPTGQITPASTKAAVATTGKAVLTGE